MNVGSPRTWRGLLQSPPYSPRRALSESGVAIDFSFYLGSFQLDRRLGRWYEDGQFSDCSSHVYRLAVRTLALTYISPKSLAAGIPRRSLSCWLTSDSFESGNRVMWKTNARYSCGRGWLYENIRYPLRNTALVPFDSSRKSLSAS